MEKRSEHTSVRWGGESHMGFVTLASLSVREHCLVCSWTVLTQKLLQDCFLVLGVAFFLGGWGEVS
jgi:hypothetical protein